MIGWRLPMINTLKLRALLEQFFLEDIGNGDITAQHLFARNKQGNMQLTAKAPGVFCGEEIIQHGFTLLNSMMQINIQHNNGDRLVTGDEIAVITGPMVDLLQAERVILNLIQRMSGIATVTSQAVKLVQGTNTKICDTRKTTPGLRMLEKHAVRCGGGYNHRYGLYDTVMLKDNHILFVKSITNAVETLRAQLGHTVKIEIEVETEEQLREAIANKVDIIMFDNCSPTTITSWINQVPSSIITEASGGIELSQIPAYAASGVDYISLGYLTHSAPSLDISATVHI